MKERKHFKRGCAAYRVDVYVMHGEEHKQSAWGMKDCTFEACTKFKRCNCVWIVLGLTKKEVKL